MVRVGSSDIIKCHQVDSGRALGPLYHLVEWHERRQPHVLCPAVDGAINDAPVALIPRYSLAIRSKARSPWRCMRHVWVGGACSLQQNELMCPEQ